MHPIGYVVHVKSPGRSGGETRSYQIAQALGVTGAEVHLYGQIDHSFEWFHRVYAHGLKRPVPFGIMQLLRDFSKNDVRVVIERYHFPPFNPGFFAQRVRNRPLIFEVHGFPIDEYKMITRHPGDNVHPVTKLVTRLPTVAWERLQMAMFQRAAHFIVTSSGTKDILAGMGISQEKVSVIYNRVDPSLFDPVGREQVACRAVLNLPSDSQLVLFAGTFTEELSSVFQAASVVTDKRPSVCFIFAVNGQVALLQAMAHTHGLNDRYFRIIPPVSHQQMPNLLTAVDVVLAPYSLHSERFRKGFHYSPLKVMEALAMEKPIVTIDATEMRTVFGNIPNVQFVESGSREEWVEGILRALDMSQDPILAQGRAFVMNGYCWQDAAQMYHEIIQSVEDKLR